MTFQIRKKPKLKKEVIFKKKKTVYKQAKFRYANSELSFLKQNNILCEFRLNCE